MACLVERHDLTTTRTADDDWFTAQVSDVLAASRRVDSPGRCAEVLAGISVLEGMHPEVDEMDAQTRLMLAEARRRARYWDLDYRLGLAFDRLFARVMRGMRFDRDPDRWLYRDGVVDWDRTAAYNRGIAFRDARFAARSSRARIWLRYLARRRDVRR